MSAAGWRPVFLLNVPVGAVLIAVGGSLPGGRERVRSRLDVPGVLILSTAMTAVVVPLVFGREEGLPPWTWVCLAAGCAGLAVFAWHERRAASPLLDLGVLRAPGVAPGLFAACAVMGAYAGLIFALALHLQSGLALSPLAAGLAFLPYTVGFAAAGLSWPRLAGARPPAGRRAAGVRRGGPARRRGGAARLVPARDPAAGGGRGGSRGGLQPARRAARRHGKPGARVRGVGADQHGHAARERPGHRDAGRRLSGRADLSPGAHPGDRAARRAAGRRGRRSVAYGRGLTTGVRDPGRGARSRPRSSSEKTNR